MRNILIPAKGNSKGLLSQERFGNWNASEIFHQTGLATYTESVKNVLTDRIAEDFIQQLTHCAKGVEKGFKLMNARLETKGLLEKLFSKPKMNQDHSAGLTKKKLFDVQNSSECSDEGILFQNHSRENIISVPKGNFFKTLKNRIKLNKYKKNFFLPNKKKSGKNRLLKRKLRDLTSIQYEGVGQTMSIINEDNTKKDCRKKPKHKTFLKSSKFSNKNEEFRSIHFNPIIEELTINELS